MLEVNVLASLRPFSLKSIVFVYCYICMLLLLSARVWHSLVIAASSQTTSLYEAELLKQDGCEFTKKPETFRKVFIR